MPPSGYRTLAESLRNQPPGAARAIHGARASVDLDLLARRRALRVPLAHIAGRSVMVFAADPLVAALAMVELDGVAARMVLCPPGVDPDHLTLIAATASADVLLCASADAPPGLSHLARVELDPETQGEERDLDAAPIETQWILLTSGTSGVPKLVQHSLVSLAGAIAANGPLAGPLVWSTFYDIRRYGGLQIYLRALIGGGSLVLSDPSEPMDAFLARAASRGVTHLTGTPSHWRRALMGGLAHVIAPRYARMSGEIADQAIIDRLRATYPDARVAHAFASTEGGVGFEVDDGLAGFPEGFVGRPGAAVEVKVENETLHLRSPRTALRYLGEGAPALRAPDGFVDTGDVLQHLEGRYHFVGRRGGTINVGGQKVHPEEVESVINRHPAVRLSHVKARKNPITGSLVVAEIVPIDAGRHESAEAAERLKAEVLELCRAHLAPYKVPAAVRVVATIAVAPSGKIARVDA